MKQKKQKGASFFGWILILSVIAILGSIAMQLVPAYLDYSSVRSSVKGLAETPRISTMDGRAIKTLLIKRLKVNNIRYIKPSDFTVERENDVLVVHINYDHASEMYKNDFSIVSMDIHFEETIEMIVR